MVTRLQLNVLIENFYYEAECSIRVTALLEYISIAHLVHLVDFRSVTQWLFYLIPYKPLKTCSKTINLPL